MIISEKQLKLIIYLTFSSFVEIQLLEVHKSRLQ